MSEKDQKPEMQKKDEPELMNFYAHVSRAWNSAVTMTLAGIALSAAVMFSVPFKDLTLPWQLLLVIIFASAVIFFGFLRVVDFGNQLNFLMTKIKMCDGTSLFVYINGVDGKSGNLPRSSAWASMSFTDAQNIVGKIGWRPILRKKHIGEIVLIIAFYVIILSAIHFGFPELTLPLAN